MSMIKKAIQIGNIVEFDALNKPNWIEYNMSKFASSNKIKDSDLGGFDLKEAVKKNPDSLFVKVLAIMKEEVNDNGDAFPESELKKGAETFVGVPIFCNHQNDDIEKARGKCVHAWYDDKKGGIYIISMVDRVAYPKLARGIEQGYVSGTSMGCSVEYSICSVCHNKAHTADEYCEHIAGQKNRKYSGEMTCQFYKSKSKPLDDCPICGSSANGRTKKLSHNNQQIYEHNYGVKFIEDSFVVNPACHDCLVEDILNINEFSKKVASLVSKVNKISSCPTGACNSQIGITKAAGKQEIDYLTDAMDKIERVAKSMMAQKAHVSIEYVSDLVDTLASVQSISDELIEMGYSQLPSPMLTGEEDIELPKTSDDTIAGKETTMQPQPQMPQPVSVPTPPEVAQESIGELGSITRPKTSSQEIEKNQEIKEDFLSKFANLKEQIVLLQSLLEKVSSSDPENKESKIMDNKKTSATETDNVKVAENRNDVITEKQLEDGGKEGLGKRIDKSPDVIMEKELDGAPYTKVNFTTSDSPTERWGSYDTITEDQLETVSSINAARWNDFPEVITEKQWTEWNRAVGSVLSQSQEDIITEKQLIDFLGKHRYVTDLDVITEKQLEKGTTQQTKRWAYVYDQTRLVKEAQNAISDVIAYYNKTPDEILEAASEINDSVKNIEKAALLTLVNALPHKAAMREKEKNRYRYFAKLSSSTVKTPSTIDALVLSMADHLGDLSADDLIHAVKHIASSEKAMNKVNKLASDKLATNIKKAEVKNRASLLDSAIVDLEKPEDGVYQVHASVDEIGVKPSNKKAFLRGVIKIADQEIEKEIGQKINTGLVKVDLDEESGVVVATLKDSNILSAEEKDAIMKTYSWLNTKDEDDKVSKETRDVSKTEEVPDKPSKKEASKREAMIKEAQMFGGEMGGQGGASQAPGAGATLPQPPGAGMEQAPLESFEQSDLGEGIEDETGSMQPKPPGTMCVVCGSDDVDVVKGQGKCNNCNSEFQFKVSVEVTKWSGLMDNDTSDEDQEIGDEEVMGEGFAMPEEGEAGLAPVGEMPAAASSTESNRTKKVAGFAVMTKLNKEAIAKANNIVIGSISPVTGSTNTVKLENGKYVCLDTGTPYTVSYAVEAKKPENVYAEWRWNPHIEVPCEDCSRTKKAFVEALKDFGIEEDAFDTLSLKEKGKTVLAMKENGLFKRIKTASKNKVSSVIKEYQSAYGTFKDSFPIESCVEKLARRYGKDALALSGPCEGKLLADCVCNSLKKASVYSHGLAIKIADIWQDKDGTCECLEDYIRQGFDLKQASSICEALKIKYAQFDDTFADELGENVNEVEVIDDVDGMGEVEDIDPFEDEVGSTITLELPLDVVEQIDSALDVAMGENPADEEHHTEDLPDVDVSVEVPEGAAEAIDEVADEVLDQNLGVEEGVEDVADELDADIVDEAVPDGDNIIEDIVEEDSPMMGGDVGADTDALSGSKKGPGVPDGTGPGRHSDECPVCGAKKNKGEKEDNSEEDEEDDCSPSDEGEEFKEGQDEMSSDTGNDMGVDQIESEANTMKSGYIGRTGEVNLDLSKVMEVLSRNKKTASEDGEVEVKRTDAKEKAVTQESAQDTSEIQPISGKSAIGQEEEFSADDPKVPTAKATIGKEQPPKEIRPVKIPVGSEPMGEEELEGGDSRATGGEAGQGRSKAVKAQSTNQKLDDLAHRIIEAGEKKIKPKEPVSKDPDIQPISGGKDGGKIGKEETIPAKEITDKEVKTKGGQIGKEKESLGEKPDDPKDQPSIPAGGGKMKNEKLDPEKQDKDKGTVIASGDNGSKAKLASNKEAFRIAGRMISEGMISPEQLSTKVAELSRYDLPQLQDLEKGIFSAKKGLDTVSDGFEQPLVINETSNQRTAQGELAEKLSGLFSLTKRNDEAQRTDVEMRKAFNR